MSRQRCERAGYQKPCVIEDGDKAKADDGHCVGCGELIKANRSVLQDWVMALPLMQQTVLISAIRGPDGIRKYSPVKAVVRFLRGAVLISARSSGEHEALLREDAFMIVGRSYYDVETVITHRARTSDEDDETAKVAGRFQMLTSLSGEYFAEADEYPMHFILHLIHAAEIIGYQHPDELIANRWLEFYNTSCRAFHMKPESANELNDRLCF